MLRRRTFLGGAVGALGAAFSAPLARRAAAADALAIEQAGESIAVIRGAGGNVVVLGAAEGQIVVDSGAAEHAEALLGALRELPGGGRVLALVNTHWHPEQVGGNVELRGLGAEIVAHEKTRARLSAPYWLVDEDRYRPPLPEEGRPTRTFFDRDALEALGEPIELGHLLLAHTDGDVFVHFRRANVVAAGDAISPERDPVLDWFGGGWVGGRADALTLLLERTDARTRFVPSYGPVVGRAEVEAERDLMQTLYERMVELVRQGDSAEDMVAAGVLDGLARTFDDPLAFVRSAHKGFWAHHNKLSPDIV